MYIMDSEDTYRKHPFELIIKTSGLSVNEMLDVAEVIDSFEITEDIKDFIVVDVIEATCESVLVVVTPKEALTYDMMKQVINSLLKKVKSVIGNKFIHLEAIRWRVERAGISSNLHSQRFA